MWVQATKDNIKVGMNARVKTDVYRPHYGWGSINPTDVGTITYIGIDIFRVDFPTDKNWTAVISEMEVEIMETKTKLEQLEKTIAKAQKEIQELHEAEEKAKRPKLAMGQVWKTFPWGCFIVNRDLQLISLTSGNYWDIGGGFGGREVDFTYVGRAEDCVVIHL